MSEQINTFSQNILSWFDIHGRKDLPWQSPRTPYQVWISEIMLQQTQVKTVIPYFLRFTERFPDVKSLALACDDEVMSFWTGLGYYSRCRNLHKAAKMILARHEGIFPSSLEELTNLPGIGDSTAAAIITQAFNQPATVLDGNVKRVMSRHFKIDGLPNRSSTHKKLLQVANQCLPDSRFADYTQAIMDLGALCCTRTNPNCIECPITKSCEAYQSNEVLNYPNKDIKKAKPTHSRQFLLLHDHRGQVYLEKNAPVGIWGGLWCLPQINNLKTSPNEHILRSYNYQAKKIENFKTLKHSFSHYHLEMHVKLVRVQTKTFSVRESNGQWFSPSQLQNVGTAKPIKSIVEQFFSQQEKLPETS